MARAKQPATVETPTPDAAAQVQVNGTKPESAPASTEGKTAAKRAGVKTTKGAREASKEDVDTKAQHSKQHAKAEVAQKEPDGASRAKKVGAADDEPRDQFLEHQRALLAAERNNYTRQAEELRAQAEALALEHEPGDVQFDEEGGEGGTANVDRELDLHLSAQAQAAIEEIDAALDKIAEGTYGICESCGNPVPTARLEALPHARLCVSCKSGGLTARRQ
jgi:RNA polymerase-binding transcription factor